MHDSCLVGLGCFRCTDPVFSFTTLWQIYNQISISILFSFILIVNLCIFITIYLLTMYRSSIYKTSCLWCVCSSINSSNTNVEYAHIFYWGAMKPLYLHCHLTLASQFKETPTVMLQYPFILIKGNFNW